MDVSDWVHVCLQYIAPFVMGFLWKKKVSPPWLLFLIAVNRVWNCSHWYLDSMGQIPLRSTADQPAWYICRHNIHAAGHGRTRHLDRISWLLWSLERKQILSNDGNDFLCNFITKPVQFPCSKNPFFSYTLIIFRGLYASNPERGEI